MQTSDKLFIIYFAVSNCFKLRFNVWSANNFNKTSLNLLRKEDRENHLPLFQYLRHLV